MCSSCVLLGLLAQAVQVYQGVRHQAVRSMFATFWYCHTSKDAGSRHLGNQHSGFNSDADLGQSDVVNANQELRVKEETVMPAALGMTSPVHGLAAVL